MGDSLQEVMLAAGDKAIQIALGSKHSCALLNSGIIKCWGDNEFGQLGYGNTVNTNTPIQSY